MGLLTTREEFARMMCKRMGVPWWYVTKRALVAWMQTEGSRARFNPLATTRRMEGSLNFNSAGVQNYTSLSQGLQATVLTLQEDGHGYEKIRRRLHVSPSALFICYAVVESAWGTGEAVDPNNEPLLFKVLKDVKRDYPVYANLQIGV